MSDVSAVQADRVPVRRLTVLYDAKLSDGPHNLTSDGRIVDTNHVDPSAATYARGLRDHASSLLRGWGGQPEYPFDRK